jgi:DNA-binding IscR family transcriptional regulator
MLERKGLIVPSREDPPGYLPAKDLEVISIKEILDVVRMFDGDGVARDAFIALPGVDSIMEKADASFYQSFRDETLKRLVVHTDAPRS